MKDNTSGKHDSRDYLIGRGKLKFALHDANGRPTGFRDLGNAPDFTVGVESDTYEHKSSRSGVSETDLEIAISQDISTSFTLEAANLENIKLFLSGAKSSVAVGTNAGEASMTDMHGTSAGNIAEGYWYDIQKMVGSTLTRYPKIQDADDFDLELYNGTDSVALTRDTDYELDLEFGRVFLMPGIAIDPDDYLRFTLAANAAAPTTATKVSGAVSTTVTGALKFISENANSTAGDLGQFSEVMIWNVKLTPNGDFNMISDEAAQMQFTGAITANVDGDKIDILTNDGST